MHQYLLRTSIDLEIVSNETAMQQSVDVFTEPDSSCHSWDEADVKSENKVEENEEGSCFYEMCVWDLWAQVKNYVLVNARRSIKTHI